MAQGTASHETVAPVCVILVTIDDVLILGQILLFNVMLLLVVHPFISVTVTV
jgi:hypothetical protein